MGPRRSIRPRSISRAFRPTSRASSAIAPSGCPIPSNAATRCGDSTWRQRIATSQEVSKELAKQGVFFNATGPFMVGASKAAVASSLGERTLTSGMAAPLLPRAGRLDGAASLAQNAGEVSPAAKIAGKPQFIERAITPAVSDLPAGVAETFAGGAVTPSVTTGQTTLYRVWGGKAARVGSYLTRTKPASAEQAMGDLALDPAWGNSRVFVTEVTVPPGTPIYEGVAASQGALPGRGSQVYIQREWLRDQMFGTTEALK